MNEESLEGFMMDTDTAMQFFELCIELKIETPEEKVQLLRELVKQRRATYLRNPKESIRGKNVLDLRGLKPSFDQDQGKKE